MSKLEIFCSCSKKEESDLVSLLIPSLEVCLEASRLRLNLIDYSGDNKINKPLAKKTEIIIHKSNQQMGFGEAHNVLFSKIRPKEPFLIINPDVYIEKNMIKNLLQFFEERPDAGIIEARQLPFEHPKEVSPDGKTPWASGFCCLINPKFFGDTGGFDKNFWMYCEDVDLSWRASISGYGVYQAQNAIGFHYTGVYFGYGKSKYYMEQFWSARNFIYLLYKYWGESGQKKALRMLKETAFPKYFKEGVERSYLELKKDFAQNEFLELRRIKYPGNIKVEGFNLYHKIRKPGKI